MPGTGGTFYCQNCERDIFLIKALEQRGHKVTVVPLYLPYLQGDEVLWEHTPIFYGAVNVYLGSVISWYKWVPGFFKKLMDSNRLLKLIARKSGTMRAEGLEEMTLSMMSSSWVRKSDDFQRMVGWINTQPKPDVIHLANSLLCGFIKPLQDIFNLPVICTVQDEHVWVESMRPAYIKKVWKSMGEECQAAGAIVSVSEYYTQYLKEKLYLSLEQLHTVPIGVPQVKDTLTSLPSVPPVIGFLSRLSHALGLGLLIDAFIMLHKTMGHSTVRLKLTGGSTPEDDNFIKTIKKKLFVQGLESYVTFEYTPDYQSRINFLKSLSMLCVPARDPMAYSLFQMEAHALGVPVVVSDFGAMRELIESSGGGVCFTPYTVEACAQALSCLLSDLQTAVKLGKSGRDSVCRFNTDGQMAQNIERIYIKAKEDFKIVTV